MLSPNTFWGPRGQDFDLWDEDSSAHDTWHGLNGQLAQTRLKSLSSSAKSKHTAANTKSSITVESHPRPSGRSAPLCHVLTLHLHFCPLLLSSLLLRLDWPPGGCQGHECTHLLCHRPISWHHRSQSTPSILFILHASWPVGLLAGMSPLLDATSDMPDTSSAHRQWLQLGCSASEAGEDALTAPSKVATVTALAVAAIEVSTTDWGDGVMVGWWRLPWGHLSGWQRCSYKKLKPCLWLQGSEGQRRRGWWSQQP